MSFNKSNCVIRKLYCGSKNRIPEDTADKKYLGAGRPQNVYEKGLVQVFMNNEKRPLAKGRFNKYPTLALFMMENSREKKFIQ